MGFPAAALAALIINGHQRLAFAKQFRCRPFGICPMLGEEPEEEWRGDLDAAALLDQQLREIFPGLAFKLDDGTSRGTVGHYILFYEFFGGKYWIDVPYPFGTWEVDSVLVALYDHLEEMWLSLGKILGYDQAWQSLNEILGDHDAL